MSPLLLPSLCWFPGFHWRSDELTLAVKMSFELFRHFIYFKLLIFKPTLFYDCTFSNKTDRQSVSMNGRTGVFISFAAATDFKFVMVGHWWWVMFFCFPKKRLLVITFSSVNMEEEGRPKLPTLFIVNSNNGLKTLQLQHCWRRYWWCWWCYYYRLPQQTCHHHHHQHHHRHRHPNHVHIRS